jgi:hypothetical protein
MYGLGQPLSLSLFLFASSPPLPKKRNALNNQNHNLARKNKQQALIKALYPEDIFYTEDVNIKDIVTTGDRGVRSK